MKRLFCLGVTVLFAFMASGCATIVHGTSTMVTINSEPPGATVQIGNQKLITPTSVIVKNNGARTLMFSKDGYNSTIVYLDQQLSGWVWGNILIGGVIGLCIDVMSGGAYKIQPKDIKAILEPKEIPETAPAK